MTETTAFTSRTHLCATSALVGVTAHKVRRTARWPLLAAAVVTLAGTGLLATPDQAFAQAQDIDLITSGDIYDVSSPSGNYTIGSLRLRTH